MFDDLKCEDLFQRFVPNPAFQQVLALCEFSECHPTSSSDPRFRAAHGRATFPPGEGILEAFGFLYGDLARQIALEQGLDLFSAHALADGPHELGHGGL